MSRTALSKTTTAESNDSALMASRDQARASAGIPGRSVVAAANAMQARNERFAQRTGGRGGAAGVDERYDAGEPYTEPLDRLAQANRQRLNDVLHRNTQNDEAPQGFDEEPGDDESVGDDEPRAGRKDSNLTRARESLLRSGLFTESEVDALPRDQVLRKGRKAQRQQAHSTAVWESLQSQRQPAGAQKDGQATSKGQSSAPQSRVPALDLDYEDLSKPFEAFGAEAKAAAKDAFRKLGTRLEGAISALAPQGSAPGDGSDEIEMLEGIRDEVSELFPDLADDDEAQSVAGVMAGLLKLPEFEGGKKRERLKRAMEAAARAVGLEPVGGRADSERKQRRSGAMTVGTRRKPAVAKNPREQARRAFYHILENPGDVGGARRAGGFE